MKTLVKSLSAALCFLLLLAFVPKLGTEAYALDGYVVRSEHIDLTKGSGSRVDGTFFYVTSDYGALLPNYGMRIDKDKYLNVYKKNPDDAPDDAPYSFKSIKIDKIYLSNNGEYQVYSDDYDVMCGPSGWYCTVPGRTFTLFSSSDLNPDLGRFFYKLMGNDTRVLYISELTVEYYIEEVKATDISLNKSSLTLSVGQSETLSAQVTPTNSTDSVVWSSSDETVASVDRTGKVTAKERSDTPITITATAGDVSAACAVTVTQPVTGVEITDPAADTDLAVGAEKTFVWTVSPGNANDSSVTWSSSDTSVATVSPSGVVKGAGEGEATITVTTSDGSFTDSRKVTVFCDHRYGTLIPEVPASHSAKGAKAHYHCSVCGKNFDENKNEITDLTISNAPHGEPDETHWEKDDTGHWRVCKADGCSEVIESTRAEHAFEWKTDKEPTVNEAGTKHEECTDSGAARTP